MLNKSQQIKVDVLLATYNGDRFLNTFLDSLINQTDVLINLIVGDDGSSDKTLEIINKYKKKFLKVTITQGPHNGPAENFLKLLTRSKAQYVALADQDDVWKPNHLISSIRRLSVNTSAPEMCFSSVTEFGDELKVKKTWPKLKRDPEFKNFFFQNYARGCTIVMNRELVELIKSEKNLSGIVMHDWWITLVAYSCGNVFYSPEPHIFYRLHEDNAVGNKRSRKILRINRLLKGDWKPYSQLVELESRFANCMKPSAYLELNEILELFKSSFFVRLRFLLLYKFRLRQKIGDEIKLRLIMLFYPFFK
jgi:glycosyltransferase involved in cell wall biosynthesis